jgi:hypothetical protein
MRAPSCRRNALLATQLQAGTDESGPQFSWLPRRCSHVADACGAWNRDERATKGSDKQLSTQYPVAEQGLAVGLVLLYLAAASGRCAAVGSRRRRLREGRSKAPYLPLPIKLPSAGHKLGQTLDMDGGASRVFGTSVQNGRRPHACPPLCTRLAARPLQPS